MSEPWGTGISLCPCSPCPEEEDGSEQGLGTVWARSLGHIEALEATLRLWLFLKATHERSKEVTA